MEVNLENKIPSFTSLTKSNLADSPLRTCRETSSRIKDINSCVQKFGEISIGNKRSILVQSNGNCTQKTKKFLAARRNRIPRFSFQLGITRCQAMQKYCEFGTKKAIAYESCMQSRFMVARILNSGVEREQEGVILPDCLLYVFGSQHV